MNIFEKIIDILKIDDEDEDELMDTEPVQEVAKASETLPRKRKAQGSPKSTAFPVPGKSSITIYEPKNYKECIVLVDKLKTGEILIVNYNMMTPADAVRIFCFLKGAIYALDGTVQKLTLNIFLYAPKTVEVQQPVNISSNLDDTLKLNWDNY